MPQWGSLQYKAMNLTGISLATLGTTACTVTHTDVTRRVTVQNVVDNSGAIYISANASMDGKLEYPIGSEFNEPLDVFNYPLYISGTSGDVIRVGRFV